MSRPTKPATPGQKSTLSIRASPELKSRLLEAAKKSGRSLSAEAEVRLEQSFRDERLLAAVIVEAVRATPNLNGPPDGCDWSAYASR